jgi:hypothetical protein
MEQNEKTSSRLVEKGKFHIQKQTTTFWKPLGMLLLLCTKMYFLTTTKKPNKLLEDRQKNIPT